MKAEILNVLYQVCDRLEHEDNPCLKCRLTRILLDYHIIDAVAQKWGESRHGELWTCRAPPDGEKFGRPAIIITEKR